MISLFTFSKERLTLLQNVLRVEQDMVFQFKLQLLPQCHSSEGKCSLFFDVLHTISSAY